MQISRRGLLASAGLALLPMPSLAAGAAQAITASSGRQVLLDEGGPSAEIWCYDGSAPGPLLSVAQGEELAVRLENALEQPTTIHWHGIRIDNAMDGVAHMTQPAVKPGEGFDYRFTPPDAGTYWYHPHTGQSWEQLARGLYGLLIVEEREPPDVDRDLLFQADDWRLTEEGLLDLASLGNRHDFFHAGRLGNVLTINGKPYERYPLRSGERIRLRLVSTANARVLHFRLPGERAWLMALDGQPIPPEPLIGDITLAPGQRADVILDVTQEPGSETAIQEVTNQPLDCASFLTSGEAALALRPPPAPLPDNPLAPLGAEPRQIDLIMEGGARRFLEEASYKGALLSGRDLALEHGQFWAFNGIAGMAAEPFLRAALGETWAIRMVNKTAWPHVMHLHGHHMREIARSDGPPQSQAWRDSVLMQPDTEVTVAFVADNPGKWMLHCHMLEHQAAGMQTWFEVG